MSEGVIAGAWLGGVALLIRFDAGCRPFYYCYILKLAPSRGHVQHIFCGAGSLLVAMTELAQIRHSRLMTGTSGAAKKSGRAQVQAFHQRPELKKGSNCSSWTCDCLFFAIVF